MPVGGDARGGAAPDHLGVAIAPIFSSVGGNGRHRAFRTFLSLSLKVELTGRRPWQSQRESEQRQTNPLQVVEAVAHTRLG